MHVSYVHRFASFSENAEGGFQQAFWRHLACVTARVATNVFKKLEAAENIAVRKIRARAKV
jgi:hypothetical protein